jgi:hypothetical protein
MEWATDHVGALHDDPIAAQVARIRLDGVTLERVVRALSEPEAAPPTTIETARIERCKRELALDHAAGRIDDAAYLERMAELRKGAQPPAARQTVTAEQAVTFLRTLGAVWSSAISDEARAELLHSIYERIVVTRGRLRGSDAHASRLPAWVGARAARVGSTAKASPAGFEPATRCLEGSRSVH